jgi:hypothetical protein
MMWMGVSGAEITVGGHRKDVFPAPQGEDQRRVQLLKVTADEVQLHMPGTYSTDEVVKTLRQARARISDQLKYALLQ